MNYYNPYYQNQQTQNVQSGFVSVRSEQEAMNYPVAPGNSITFKNETAPYVYTKTMGFSQLDRPIFEKYKLIKEEAEEIPTVDVKSDIDKLWGEINAIKAHMEQPTRRKKVGDSGNDE